MRHLDDDSSTTFLDLYVYFLHLPCKTVLPTSNAGNSRFKTVLHVVTNNSLRDFREYEYRKQFVND